MTRRKEKRLTPAETVIMDCLWRKSPATVKQVQEDLQNVKPMAYNTVLTLMRILRDKGFLVSDRQGRVDVYKPAVSRDQVGTTSLSDLLRNFFAGSPAALVSQLLDSDKISRDEIRTIREKVDKYLQDTEKEES